MRSFFSFLFFLSMLSVGCNSSKDQQYEGNPESLYFDYQLSAKEGDDKLTVMLQYRAGGEQGDAVAIGEIGTVELDGLPVPVDSTRKSGFFYETHQPLVSFTGKHFIVFRTTAEKAYKEEFEFKPMLLNSALADTIRKNEYDSDPMMIELEGVGPEEILTVLLTDTSMNNGVSRLDTVRDGKLLLTGDDFKNLSPGPVQLELIREYTRQLSNSTETGGRLLISYSLKREFVLKG